MTCTIQSSLSSYRSHETVVLAVGHGVEDVRAAKYIAECLNAGGAFGDFRMGRPVARVDMLDQLIVAQRQWPDWCRSHASWVHYLREFIINYQRSSCDMHH